MKALREWLSAWRLPSVAINLRYEATEQNDPFYRRAVESFYAETRCRHRKFPLVRHWQFGVALCRLPADFDSYFMMLESSARRNFRKAERAGYRFQTIVAQDFQKDLLEIWQSTDVRQGKMPSWILAGRINVRPNPPSCTKTHDYPYFGIVKEGKLVAYAGCLIAGDVCMIEHIFGHAGCQADGIVPMLLIGIVRHVKEHYPQVQYYTYEMFFGSSPTMRRFKKKFKFLPHKVTWVLG